jgi:hypothetical protein
VIHKKRGKLDKLGLLATLLLLFIISNTTLALALQTFALALQTFARTLANICSSLAKARGQEGKRARGQELLIFSFKLNK